MNDDELVWFGAVELGRQFAPARPRPGRATEACLERIASLNPRLEALVTLTEDGRGPRPRQPIRRSPPGAGAVHCTAFPIA